MSGSTHPGRPSLIPPDRPAVLDRWSQRLGSTARWGDADKCLLVQGLLVCASGVLSLLPALCDGWPFYDAGLDPALLRKMGFVSLGLWSLWPVLIAVTVRLRTPRRRPRPGLVLATVHGYALQIAWFAYVTGPYRTPSGLAMLGGIVVGLMLFPNRVVLQSIAVNVAATVGLYVTGRAGLHPFEPLLVAAEGPRVLQTRWVLRQLAASAVPGLLVVTVLVMIIESWRYREGRLELASRTDALTGVFNRGYLMQTLQRLLPQATAERPLTVLMIDVDHFKRINDRHGHLVGDAVLRELADALRACLRSNDRIGRYGGEEFLVLLPEVGADDAHLVAERCREAVGSLRFPNAEGLRVTASFGIATAPPLPNEGVDAILDAADAALYRAKSHGRDRVERAIAPEPEAYASDGPGPRSGAAPQGA